MSLHLSRPFVCLGRLAFRATLLRRRHLSANNSLGIRRGSCVKVEVEAEAEAEAEARRKGK